MKILEKILVILIILVLALPAIQKEYPFAKLEKLGGDFVLAEKPTFTCASWYSGNFQSEYDIYLEDHIGFRDFLVRLTNQIDYGLYRIPHADGIIVGKNDQLFEYDYIRAFMGEDFIGEENIDRKIRKLKFIQEHLKEVKNIDLVLVFEPDKVSFFPESIPDLYLDHVSSNTNFDSFLKKAIEYDVKFIDFKAYFNSLKGTTQYPLYPQYGIHWSIYGMSYAADSLVSYIENIRDIDLPEYYIDSLQVDQKSRRPDYDIGKTLNLLFRLHEKNKLAYPIYRFEEKPNIEKPNVLAIADSYYWNIFNTRIPKNLFQKENFWYFYKQIYPDFYSAPKNVSDINLQEEIEKQDVIFLMITARFLFKFGWNFIEDTYGLYGPSSKYDKIHDYKCDIWNYNVWFTSTIENAIKRNISLEEMLSLAAEYTYGQADIESLLMYKGIDYYKEVILNDPNRYKKLQALAIEKNIAIEELIEDQAKHNFKTKHPETYIRYNQLKSFKQKIKNDSLLLSDARKYAKKYYLTLEESIQINAELMYLEAIPN